MGRPIPSRETKLSGANGNREIFIFLFIQLTTDDWQPYPVDLYSAIYVCMVTHIARV